MFTITGWRLYYRRYLGWFPIQFCMVCSKPYWGGFPTWGWVKETYYTTSIFSNTLKLTHRHKLQQTWQASWREYCSMKCCQEDNEECWRHHN